MALSIRNALLLITVVLLIVLPGSMGSIKRNRIHVTVKNDMSMDLALHCKSKDDDLGLQILQPQGSFKFTFWPNVWGTTLYFCTFGWQDQTQYFDIFVQRRDTTKCSECVWSIIPTGPCRFNSKTGQFDICYPWKKSLSSSYP